MNKVMLIGRICKDIELKTASEKQFARFTLAVNRRGKDSGADFISCVAFDKTAEFISKYFKKGSQLGLVGHIQTGSYDDKDGKKVYTTDIMVEEVYFVGNKEDKEESQDKLTDADLPF